MPGWAIVVLTSMVIIEVLSRYILHSPFIVADEMGAYLLIFIAFMGLSYTWQERGHVRITFIISRMSIETQKWLRLLTLFMAAVFNALLIKATYDLFIYSFEHHQRSGTWLRVPLQWPQIALVIGSILLSLHVITEIIKAVKTIRSDEEGIT